MPQLVVNFIGILAKSRMQFGERPGNVIFRVDGFGHLPNIFRNLRVATKVMDELGVGGIEESFTD